MKLCFLLIATVASLIHANLCNINNLDKTQAKELMTRDLLADNQTDTYTCDPDLHIEVMREIIEEQLTNTTAKLVLNFASRQQEVFLYLAYLKIFETIKKKGLGDDVTFSLGYKIMTDFYKEQVASLLNIFEISVRSILKATIVCIKSTYYNEYFFADESQYNFDATRRRVLTWPAKRKVGVVGHWKFVHIEGNKFHILNKYNEYLHASTTVHDNDRRNVFAWTHEWELGSKNEWAIETVGEDVYIRNVFFDEYMYAAADKYKFGIERRRVFTYIPKGRTVCDGNPYQCRWLVTVCGD